MPANDRTEAQRWASKNTHPGSMFHELVAVPTLLPAAARPYELPGMRPGTSALDNIRWEQPVLRGAGQSGGMISTSSFSRSLTYSIPGATQPVSAHTPSTSPNLVRPMATSDLPASNDLPFTPGPRTRFIKPIDVHLQQSEQAPSHPGETPLPVSVQLDSQSTQDPVIGQGMYTV